MLRKAVTLAAIMICAGLAHADWVWTPERGWHNPRSESRGTAQQLYRGGLSHFESGNYTESARTFDELAKQFPGSRYAKKAQFYSGESHFEAGELWDAYISYEEYLRDYPESREIETIVEKEYEIGRAFLNGERKKLMFMSFLTIPSPDSGIEILESVIEHSPYSDIADDALYAIATYQFHENQYQVAAESYRRLYLTYPESEWSNICKYQAAMCARRMSQGVSYDAGTLERARKQLVEYSAENPTETGTRGVSGQIAAIDEDLALKLWNTVLFYEKSGKNFSAGYCCRRLQALYPDTSYAALAAEWIGQHPEVTAAAPVEAPVEAPDAPVAAPAVEEAPGEIPPPPPAPTGSGFQPSSHSSSGSR